MCVHVSICTPTLFGKWSYIRDVWVSVLYPLTARQKKAQFLSKKFVSKNFREICFAFFIVVIQIV